MPRVSVLVPTMRIGGIDILLHGLAGQTFKDLELVLSDGIWSKRHDQVMQLAADYGVSVKHVEPRGNPFPLNAFCRYANETVRNMSSDSEISLTITDYTWLPPDCVARHVAAHTAHPSGYGHVGPHEYVQLPKLNAAFTPYACIPLSDVHGALRVRELEDLEKYVSDINSGSLDSVMTSILESPFNIDASTLPLCPSMGGGDPKLRLPHGFVSSDHYHAKNESFRTADILAINGWDEDLDNAHTYQDMEFAGRMTKHRGVSWDLDPTNVAYIVNPRPVFPFAKRVYHHSRNAMVWKNKETMGYPLPPPLFP